MATDQQRANEQHRAEAAREIGKVIAFDLPNSNTGDMRDDVQRVLKGTRLATKEHVAFQQSEIARLEDDLAEVGGLVVHINTALGEAQEIIDALVTEVALLKGQHA